MGDVQAHYLNPEDPKQVDAVLSRIAATSTAPGESTTAIVGLMLLRELREVNVNLKAVKSQLVANG